MPDRSAWGVRRVGEGGAAPRARPEPPPHAPHTPCSMHALDPVGTGTCWPSPAPGPAGSSGQGQQRHHVGMRPVWGGLLGLGGPHTPLPSMRGTPLFWELIVLLLAAGYLYCEAMSCP